MRVLLNAHGNVEKLRDVARIVAASGWVKQKLVTDIEQRSVCIHSNFKAVRIAILERT